MLLEGSCHSAPCGFGCARAIRTRSTSAIARSAARRQAAAGSRSISAASTIRSRSRGASTCACTMRRCARCARPNRTRVRPRATSARVRQSSLALGSALAGAGASARFGHRHAPADAARAHPSDARIQGVVGRAGDRAERPAVRRVSRGKHRGLVRAPRAHDGGLSEILSPPTRSPNMAVRAASSAAPAGSSTTLEAR